MNEIRECLKNQRLIEAIALLDEWNAKLSEAKFTDDLSLLRQNYEHLLHYFAAGLQDEKRQDNHREFLAQAYILYNKILRQNKLENEASSPYSTARYVLKKCDKDLNVSALYQKSPAYWEENYTERWRSAFECVWVSEAWTESDEQNMLEMLTENGLPHNLRAFMVTAMMMAVMESFDIRKLRLLMALCRDPECRVRIRAKIGVVYSLARHVDFLWLFPEIEDEISFFCEEDAASLAEWRMIQEGAMSDTVDTNMVPEELRGSLDMLKMMPKPDSPTKWFWPMSSTHNPDFQRFAQSMDNPKLKELFGDIPISLDDLKMTIDNDDAQMQIASYQMMAKLYFKTDFRPLELYLRLVQTKKPYGAAENFAIAECYNALGDMERAVAHYEHCLAQDEKSLSCLKKLGKIYRAQGKKEEALKVFEAALALSPDDWKILYNLSTSYMSLKDYASALPHLFKAHYLAADEDDVTRALATCQLYEKHFEEAVKLFVILAERET